MSEKTIAKTMAIAMAEMIQVVAMSASRTRERR